MATWPFIFLFHLRLFFGLFFLTFIFQQGKRKGQRKVERQNKKRKGERKGQRKSKDETENEKRNQKAGGHHTCHSLPYKKNRVTLFIDNDSSLTSHTSDQDMVHIVGLQC